MALWWPGWAQADVVARQRGGVTSGRAGWANAKNRRPSVAACARDLARSGGVLSRRTPEGDVEREVPPSCGGGYERRTRTRDVCRDDCFLELEGGRLAIAARFREGDLVVVLGRAGRHYTQRGRVALGSGEVRLLDPAAAQRILRSFSEVHGAAATAPALREGEAVLFHVLGWNSGTKGWVGRVAAVAAGPRGMRLVPVAQVEGPRPARDAVSRAGERGEGETVPAAGTDAERPRAVTDVVPAEPSSRPGQPASPLAPR